MKIKDGETLEEWSERVRQFEFGHAMQALANGVDTDTILDQMSVRISNKIKHYIITNMKVDMQYDAITGKQEYNEIMKRTSPVADHVNWE